MKMKKLIFVLSRLSLKMGFLKALGMAELLPFLLTQR